MICLAFLSLSFFVGFGGLLKTNSRTCLFFQVRRTLSRPWPLAFNLLRGPTDSLHLRAILPFSAIQFAPLLSNISM